MSFNPPTLDLDLISIDVESTGLSWIKDKIFGIAVADRHQSVYYDVRETPKALDWVRDQAQNAKKIVNHHMKFDIHMLRESGVPINPRKTDCTMIRAALLNEHLHKYDLDSLAKKHLGEKKDDSMYSKLADIFGGKATRKAQMPNISKAPSDIVRPYAKIDVELAIKMYLWQEKKFIEEELEKVYALEKRLFPHVIEMERHGIRVDIELAERQREKINVKVEELKIELNKTAGFEVNPNPSGSIHKLFAPKWVAIDKDHGYWEAVDGTRLEKTDAGKPSFDAKALQRMKHPAASQILRIRDVFIGGHILGHHHEGRVFPNINQTKGDETGGTGTGRLSYTEPALQQIPKRDKENAAIVRPIFVPDDGQSWSYGDLDQHEYRIFAHYVENPEMTKSYQDNPDLDFHQKVADLTGLPRSAPVSGGPNAKQLNLGMVFCMGAGQLADDCGLPWKWDEFTSRQGEVIKFKKSGSEGLDMVEKYHGMIPGIRELAKKAKRIAERRGYIITMHGRHIRFPRPGEARKASGLLYQGSSADENKVNMCLISEYFESVEPESRLLLNIHDEYSISLAPTGKEYEHLRNIKNLIQDKPYINIPIRIDFSKPCNNWFAATKAKKITL
jgi:DNA polymerase I-like protein with 3'-5' exonuclease and polymerase domains